MSDIVAAAERVRQIVIEAERPVKRMTLGEWRSMYHYTCSVPTGPKPGFVYAAGPHKPDSDPTTDPWWCVECVADDEPGYVRHVPTRILIICGRLLVGRGSDRYDPLCTLDAGHEGPCCP